MSIYEDEIKVKEKEAENNMLDSEVEDNLTEQQNLTKDLNEEIIITSNEHNLIKNEVKKEKEDEVLIKNPRSIKDKKAIEYIEEDDYSNKPWSITLILCILLGFIGFHRFYVGKAGTAILMLLTFGGFGIWVLVDLIRIIINNFTDEEGKVIKRVSLAS